MKRLSVFLSVSLILFSAGFEASAEETLSPYLAGPVSAKLLTEKKLSSASFGDTTKSLQFFPETPLKAVLTEAAGAIDPNVTIEVLFLYEKRGTDFTSPGAHLKLYKLLRDGSRLAGIEYFSASRYTYRTFYSESYAIDSLESKKKIGDPTVKEIPGRSSVFLFQNDLTFGKNYYEATYRYAGDSIAMTTVNRSKFTYYLMPVIAQGNFLTHIVVVPLQEKIIVYFLSCSKVPGMFGMQERIERSFTNRAEALYTWFSGRIDKAF